MPSSSALRPGRSIRLVACDMDGTLLNDDFVLTPATKDAVKRLKERDVQFVLVSGRMRATVLPFHRELALITPIISYNGALIWDTQAGRVIEHTAISFDVAQEALDLAETEKLHAQYFWDDRFWASERNAWMALYEGRLRMRGEIVRDLREFGPDRLPTKLQFITSPERVSALIPQLREQYRDRLYITNTLPEYIELMNPLVSKGRALRIVADSLGISLDNALVFGDSQNDETMFEIAGLSVAMENARQEVQQKATLVTASNDDDGVAMALEALGLLA